MSSFFGLDIGSNQVKVLQAEKVNQGFKVIKSAAVMIQPMGLVETIKSVIKEAGIKSTSEANVAFPESDVFTKIVDTPRLSETELASSIQYEAEQYIPIPLEEVDLYHQILADKIEDEKLMKVLLIAVPKIKIQELLKLFNQVELIPRSLETELFSLKRLLVDSKKVQILANFGHKTTDLLILKYGVPSFTYSINIGGLALNKSLVNELSLVTSQAEEYKNTYGLREDLLEGKVAKILKPIIDEIVNQINKAMIYLQQQGFNKTADELILSGGGALLPGLSSYLTSKLSLEVMIADPFKKFIQNEDLKKRFPFSSNPQWTTVTGLALKGWV